MKTTIKINGMSCDHCVKHVTEALGELTGVHSVEVSLSENQAVVEHEESATLASMKEAIEEAGYEVI